MPNITNWNRGNSILEPSLSKKYKIKKKKFHPKISPGHKNSLQGRRGQRGWKIKSLMVCSRNKGKRSKDRVRKYRIV
jgi:hypothetical protein